MQLDGNSFWGDVVLDSFEKAFRDKNNISVKIRNILNENAY